MIQALALCVAPLFAQGGDAPEIARLRAENARLRADLVVQRARAAQLSTELDRLGDRWVQRELELLRMQRELAQLAPDGALSQGLATLLDLPAEQAADAVPEEAAAPDPERLRAEEIGRDLQALLWVEGVRGLQLFDAGRVLPEDEHGTHGIGPVLIRMADEDGRAFGHLWAERLVAHASRTGRTLTLELERGYTSRGGTREPFTADVHRITLRHVDPRSLYENCPELFSSEARETPADDGLWSKARLAYQLNRLLGAETSVQRYRLEYFDGVNGADFLDVELSVRGPQGRLERRLFADRMHIAEGAHGIVIELTGGVSVRGADQVPFLDGRLRLLLPRADVEAWRAASLPGLSEPPVRDEVGDGRPAGA